MKKLKEKYVRLLSMIMICAILLGSVPVMPTQAAGNEATVSGSEGTVSGSEGTVSGSEGTVSGSEGTVSGSEGTVSESEGTVSGSEGTVSGSEGTVGGSEENGNDKPGSGTVAEGENVELAFQLKEGSPATSLQIIPLDEYGNESTPVTGKISVKSKEEFRFKLKVEEGYKITEVSMGALLVNPQNGIYSITPTGAVTINVAIAELKKYDVSFSYNEEQVKNLKVYMGKQDVTLQDKVAVEMPEDSIISFDVELENMMKIVKVTADGEALKPVSGTSYALKALKQDVDVKIETSLDPAKCNTVTVVIKGHAGSASVRNRGKIYHGGDTILTTAAMEELGVFVDENYLVNEVLLNGKKVDFTGTNTNYMVNFSSSQRVQKIEITTTPKVSTEVKKVIFANKSEHITYTLNTYAVGTTDVVIAEKENGKDNTYLVKAGQTILEFTIAAQSGYIPKVEIPTGVLYDVVNKEGKQIYSLVVSSLGNREAPTEIIIDENPQVRSISVRYEKDKVEEIVAIVDGKVFPTEEVYDSSLKRHILNFIYSYNKEVILQIKTKEGYVLEEIREGTGKESEKKASPYKNSYTYTVKLDKDKYVELKVKGEYTSKIFADTEGQMPLEKEGVIFLAESGSRYVAHLYLGNERQSVKSAVLKNGTKVINGNITIENSENVKFTIPQSEKGKTLTLELNAREGLITSFVKIRVLPEMKITSITGVKKGKLTQEVDTIKEYKIKSNLSVKKLEAEVVTAVAEEEIITEEQRNQLNQKAAAIFVPTLEEDALKLRVNVTQAGEKAYIKLYDPSKTVEGKKHYVTGGTILVTAGTPAFVGKKPTVKQESATNLNLVLNLKLKDPGKIESGALWYKIDVLPKYNNKTDDSIIANTSPLTIYRPYYQETQLETIRVVGADNQSLAEGDIAFKADFQVSVSLVQTKERQNPEETGEAGNVVFTSKNIVKKTMSTKAPLYETKLGIKVQNGIVYSGQQGVVTAVPVFSKNTSYQELECYSSHDGIQAVYNEKRQIVVSVEPEVEPGKYTIEVVAEAAENTLPAKKEFTIEVVQGIYSLEVKASETVYKAYKKSSSLKAEVIYNENSKSQPKTKKVEWFLEDAQENEIVKGHEKYGIFSIDQGKITIDEKYIVSGEEEENKFRVKVVAADFKREEEQVVGYSDWITVTNTAVALGELVLVKENQEDSTYEVMARGNQKVAAYKIQDSRLMILKKGVPEREVYSEDDFVTEEVMEALTLTSSNEKVLQIGEDRIIDVKNMASGITITAKTMDGSNKSTALSNLSMVLSKPSDLGIIVTNLRNQAVIADTYSTQGNISYYGLKDETLRISLKDKGQKNSFFAGAHEIEVTGAKIISSKPLEGIYEVVTTSENIVITLINKGNEMEKQFRLQNKTFDNSKVTNSKAVTLKVEGTLKTGYSDSEQRLYFTLPKEYIGKFSHAWITMDTMELQNSEKKENYEALKAVIKKGLNQIQTLDDKGRAVLVFDAPEEEEMYFIPNKSYSYKFNVAVGSVTKDYDFAAEVKTNKVTVKTTKAKAMNTAIKSSYSISLKEEALAYLEMKDKKVGLVSVEPVLLNKNIKGKNNRFAEFFEITEIEDEEGKTLYAIKLQDGADPAEIKTADTSGYLAEYVCTDGKENKVVNNTLIKVNIKSLIGKYKLTQAGVFKSDTVDTTVCLLRDGVKVAAGSVFVKEKEAFTVDITGDGELQVQSKPDKKLKATNKFNVYVLPEESFYGKIISADSEEDMVKYGIKLSLVVKMKNKATATGKIKFASKDKKVVLKAEHFQPEEGTVMGSYKVQIPYTRTIDWQVEAITQTKEDSLVKVTKVPEEDKIEITLSKKELKAAYTSNKKIYGSTLTVPILAEFGEGTKAEKHSIKVVLPKMPVQMEGAVKAFQKIQWKDLTLSYTGQEADRLTAENQPIVEEQLQKILGVGGDITYTINGTAQAATKTAEGKILYTVILTDAISQNQKRVTAEFIIERIYTTPGELEAVISEKLLEWENKKITNQTRIADILDSVRSAVKLEEYPHLRLYAKSVSYRAATMNEEGSILGSLKLISLKEGEDTAIEFPYEYTIPKLLTVEEAITAIRSELESLTLTNSDLGDKREEKEAYLLDLAQEIIEGNEYSVTLQRGLSGNAASAGEDGTATMIFKITYLTDKQESQEFTCEFVITM